MPKEVVRDMVTDGFQVHVGWSSAVPDERDGLVQVATRNEHSPFRFPLEHDEKGTPTTQEAGEPFHGWHVTLDRDGINRLIRNLRTARDKAFGPDA